MRLLPRRCVYTGGKSNVYKVCSLYSDISYTTKNVGSLVGKTPLYFYKSFFLFSFLVLCLALTFKKVRQTFLSPSNSEVPELSKIARDILG